MPTTSFDVSKIGAAAQYRGFGIFQKTGSSTWTLTGATAAVDTANAKYVRVQAWRTDSASAGSCTIYLQLSIDGTAWVDVKTFTNLTGLDATRGSGGDGVTVPSMNYARLYMTAAATGTFTVKLDVQR